MRLSPKVILFAILLLAFLIRWYRVAEIPSGVWYDELDAGYQARSLLQTGRDYRGTFSLFYVNSFLDPRTPIPIWLTVATTAIFKTPELQIRLPSVFLGTLVVLLVYLLVKLWQKDRRSALIAALVFAVNPWQINFSRISHESLSSIAFPLAALVCFYIGLTKKQFRYFVFSVILLSLAMYTYRTMSLLVPLFFILTAFIYRREFLALGWKKLLVLAGIAAAITMPFIQATYFGARDTPRINQLNIAQNKEIPIWIQRDRELDSGDLQNPTIGKQAAKPAYFFHNKPASIIGAFAQNYMATFSTEFLLYKGDSNHRQSIPNFGMIHFIDIVGLLFGLFVLIGLFHRKTSQLLIGLFLVTPIASSLTIDGAQHGARLFAFSVPLLLIIGVGWAYIISRLKRRGVSGKFFLVIGAGAYFLLVIFYLHQYFVHSPIDTARDFTYGYRETMQEVDRIQAQYQRVVFSNSQDPPILYYLFWANIDPRAVQAYGTRFEADVIKHQPLDKFKITVFPAVYKNDPKTWQVFLDLLQPSTLYVLNAKDLPFDLRWGNPVPPGIRRIDTIDYPDNTAAYYLIRKDIGQ
jgi:4-amino-4-deoxy-L-arabinose transferase-like glycosyltransferase